MKRSLIAVLLLGVSLFSCQEDAPSGPTQPNQPPTSPDFDWIRQENSFTGTLYDVFFVSSSEGWAVGEQGALLSTTSSGESWLLAPSHLTDELLHAVSMADSQTGWVAGQLSAGAEGGQVFLSQQGGAYPEEQARTEHPLYSICMPDAQRGWAGGAQGLLLHTTDGGSTWSPDTLAEAEAILSVHFPDAEQGWLATAGGSIYRTDDGSTWEPETTPDTTAIRAIHAVDETTVWACGDRNRLLHRTVAEDGTVSWELMRIDTEPSSLSWNDIFFVDAQQGWVVGQGGSIYHTTDGGATWTRQLINSSRVALHAIHMVSRQRGWVVGEEGMILTYTP